MTIAVHINLPDTTIDTNATFNYHCFRILAAQYPLQHFIFIFDKPFPADIITAKNITPVLLGPQIKNRLLEYYFYNFKLPRLLNKYNAGIFVSMSVCSLRTTVPQCIILPDLSFLKKKNLYSKNDAAYLKRYTKLFVKRALTVAVMNAHLKKTLLQVYGLNENKINTIHTGIDPVYQPVDDETADNTRQRFTEGTAFFLFFATATATENIIPMLKAFSIFKKWQKSSMKLLILFSSTDKNNHIKELSSYKYRADVKIISDSNNMDLVALTAAAYAAIHLPTIEITESVGLNCLAAAVPLITSSSDFCTNIYKEGALYSSAAEKELAEKMMLLYKDEHARKTLVEKGKLIAATYSRQNAAAILWQTIQPVAAV